MNEGSNSGLEVFDELFGSFYEPNGYRVEGIIIAIHELRMSIPKIFHRFKRSEIDKWVRPGGAGENKEGNSE